MVTSQPTPSERRSARQAILLRALSTTDRLSTLLPLLHQDAVDAIGGRASILFEFDLAGERLRASAGRAMVGQRRPGAAPALSRWPSDFCVRSRTLGSRRGRITRHPIGCARAAGSHAGSHWCA